MLEKWHALTNWNRKGSFHRHYYAMTLPIVNLETSDIKMTKIVKLVNKPHINKLSYCILFINDNKVFLKFLSQQACASIIRHGVVANIELIMKVHTSL